MSLFTISRPIPLDAPVTIATLGLPESASLTRPPDEADPNVMIVFSLCIAAYRRYKQTLSSLGNITVVKHNRSKTIPGALLLSLAVEQLAAAVPLSVQDYSPTVRTIFPICEPSGACR